MNIFVGAPGREFLGPSAVFIILFVTFGPINFISRFYRMTKAADAKALARLAVRNVVIATVGIVLSAVVGTFMLGKWQISVPAIALTGAVVLFLAAMKSILALYGGAAPDAGAEVPSQSTASQLLSPYIATPYGIAALIVLLTLAPNSATQIYVILLAVMLIDLIVMLFVKPVMRVMGIPLGLLGTVLSVLQMALSIQFAFFAIRTALAKGI